MNETETGYKIFYEADTKQIREAIKLLKLENLQLGQSITKSFEDIIFKAKDVESVFKSLALQLSNKAFNNAIKPIEELVPKGIDQGVESLFGSFFGFAKGGAFTGSAGGVLNSPLAFPLGGGNVGVAGEAGPEAILPLTRGANGELGVRASGGEGMNITVNIAATDLNSFRRSESEIAATLQRITSRGNRNL